MKQILFIIITLLMAVFQTSPFSLFLEIKGVKPNIALIFLLYYAICQGSFRAQFVGFGLGLVLDALIALQSNTPLGVHAFVYTIVGVLIGFLKDKFYLGNFLFVMLLTFAVSFFSEGLIKLLYVIVINQTEDPLLVLKILAAFSLYNAVIAPVFFLILNRLFSFAEMEKEDVY